MKYILSFTLIISALCASETDQYLSWGTDLADSQQALNNYVNDSMYGAIDLPATQKQKSCHDVAKKLVKPMRRNFQQLIEDWAETSPLVERYPEDLVATKEYFDRSILDNPNFPYNLYVIYAPYRIPAIARTINLNGIYLGTDKLGHFISFGVRYLDEYLKSIKKGKNETAAIEQAISFGIKSEKLLVGKTFTGVLSYGDLEANFQGFLFQKSLCSTDSSFRIEGERNSWKLVGEFEIKNYVNPYWDESFNPSEFTKGRWKYTKQHLKKYCSQKSLVKDRFAYYQQLAIPSVSIQYIEKMINTGKLNSPSKYSLEQACQQ